jgi:REP element-mobilizing transposase RayT
MSRPLRLEYPGATYHVHARGNAGQAIFQRDGDREQFLILLGREIQQTRWQCFGFCLLEADYRLVVETPEANLGRGIGRLNAVYSQWFNRRYGRAGHLFQGRYKATLIEKEAYLLPLVRDLAWAPVRAGLAKRPGQWDWSSHRAIGKDRETPPWLAVQPVLSPFAKSEEGPRKAYRSYVAEGRDAPTPLDAVRAQMYLGGEAFLRSMASRVRDLPADQVPKAMLRPDRPTQDTIIAAVAAAAGVPPETVLDRHVRQDVFQAAVYLLRRGANLSLKEVAALAAVSPPRVSQIQRAIEDAGGLGRAFRWARPLTTYLG